MFCEESFTIAGQVNWWVIDLKYKLKLVQCDCVPKIYQPICIVTTQLLDPLEVWERPSWMTLFYHSCLQLYGLCSQVSGESHGLKILYILRSMAWASLSLPWGVKWTPSSLMSFLVRQVSQKWRMGLCLHRRLKRAFTISALLDPQLLATGGTLHSTRGTFGWALVCACSICSRASSHLSRHCSSLSLSRMLLVPRWRIAMSVHVLGDHVLDAWGQVLQSGSRAVICNTVALLCLESFRHVPQVRITD